MNYLRVKENNVPTFSVIPKIHKDRQNHLGQLLVSAINRPLKRVGKYVDWMIKEMVPKLKSYVQDTNDVLLQIKDVVMDKDTWLVSINLESLYTSISHIHGLRAVFFFLEHHFPNICWNLFYNIFFWGSYYHQTRGTLIRVPWAPSYACLHLGAWEEEVVYVSSLYCSHALFWLRYMLQNYKNSLVSWARIKGIMRNNEALRKKVCPSKCVSQQGPGFGSPRPGLVFQAFWERPATHEACCTIFLLMFVSRNFKPFYLVKNLCWIIH